MHKGEVVEEGDHESLMRARGTYYGLVEQQNLRRAEEEEQLAFERQESTAVVQALQGEENQLSVITRNRASTVISLTPSVMAALYGKRKNSTANEEIDEEKEEEAKKAKVKIRVN